MSTDLLPPFTPMTDGLDFEGIGNGQIRILLLEDRLFHRHAIRPVTSNLPED